MTSPKESAGIHYSTRIFFKAKMNLYLVQQSITNLLLAKGVGEAIGLYQLAGGCTDPVFTRTHNN